MCFDLCFVFSIKFTSDLKSQTCLICRKSVARFSARGIHFLTLLNGNTDYLIYLSQSACLERFQEEVIGLSDVVALPFSQNLERLAELFRALTFIVSTSF